MVVDLYIFGHCLSLYLAPLEFRWLRESLRCYFYRDWELVLGPGVIGDIYHKLEERGRAMSVFLSVSASISRFLHVQFLLYD